MKIYEIDPIADSRWAQFVTNHPQASLFHEPRWLRALNSSYAYLPVAYTTSPPGKPIDNGILFCKVNSWVTGRRLVSLPFSDHCEPLANSVDELEHLLLFVRQTVDDGQYKRVEIRPLACQHSKLCGLAAAESFMFHQLDLRPSIETIYSGLHKDCIQRKIRRAEREDLKYEEGNSERHLQQFLHLMRLTRRRHGLPTQPERWFRALIANFGTDLKIRLASKGSTPVASILTISHHHTLVYKYGCSDYSASRLGGTPLLFWRAIQEAKGNQLDKLDLGRSDIDGEGLITFKNHLGAESSTIQYWNYPSKTLRAPNQWLKRIRKTAAEYTPDFILRLAGDLLYRHIG